MNTKTQAVSPLVRELSWPTLAWKGSSSRSKQGQTGLWLNPVKPQRKPKKYIFCIQGNTHFVHFCCSTVLCRKCFVTFLVAWQASQLQRAVWEHSNRDTSIIIKWRCSTDHRSRVHLCRQYAADLYLYKAGLFFFSMVEKKYTEFVIN